MVAARHIDKAGRLSQTPASKYEASVYGALCGDLQTMLAVCEGDWESTAWAYTRALFDLRVDAVVNTGKVLDDVSNFEPGEVVRDPTELETTLYRARATVFRVVVAGRWWIISRRRALLSLEQGAQLVRRALDRKQALRVGTSVRGALETPSVD
jgi:hypothetical protein